MTQSGGRVPSIDQTTVAAKWLLGSSGVGCLAGVAIPALSVAWVDPGHPMSTVTATAAMVCLVVPLAGTILFGFRDHQIFLGFFAAAINIIAAAVITIFTWFMVPPSALIGMWLLLAGVLWGEARQTLRRRLLSAGLWTVVISMIVSLALLFLPSYGDYIGSLVNLGLVIWLVRSSRSPVTS